MAEGWVKTKVNARPELHIHPKGKKLAAVARSRGYLNCLKPAHSLGGNRFIHSNMNSELDFHKQDVTERCNNLLGEKDDGVSV